MDHTSSSGMPTVVQRRYLCTPVVIFRQSFYDRSAALVLRPKSFWICSQTAHVGRSPVGYMLRSASAMIASASWHARAHCGISGLRSSLRSHSGV